MTQADDRLKSLFAMSEPPSRDLAFSACVMARVLRQRFIEDVVLMVVATLIGGSVLWALWPRLQPMLVALSESFASIAGAIVLAACAGVILSGRAGSALGLES